MDNVRSEDTAHRWRMEVAAARLAGRERGVGRVTVVLGHRPSFDEVIELRRLLNEDGSDVAMSMDGDGTLIFRKQDSSRPHSSVEKRRDLAGEAAG